MKNNDVFWTMNIIYLLSVNIGLRMSGYSPY